MTRHRFLLLLALCSTMTFTDALPMQAQNVVARKKLAPLPDRFQLQKEQWSVEDRHWFELDAVTGDPNLVGTLANVAHITNSIDGNPESPDYGWQSSNVYQHGVVGPTNTRLMEPVYTLTWAYTLNKP